MIIPTPGQDTADAKRREAEAAAREAVNVEAHSPVDPPPTYTPSPDPVPSNALAAAPFQFHQQAHNFVTMARDNGSVKGSWCIDSTMAVPRAMLPRLLKDETEETRRNFNVHASNGTVEVDLMLAPTRLNKDILGRGRTTMSVKASNGTVRFATHAPHAPRLPFYLNVRASNGTVSLQIPRTFHGLLTLINYNGHPKFLGQVKNQVHIFNEVNNTCKGFIGDYSGLDDDEPWAGDEIYVEAGNGHIKIQYDDDIIERERGFFSRLLGMKHPTGHGDHGQWEGHGHGHGHGHGRHHKHKRLSRRIHSGH